MGFVRLYAAVTLVLLAGCASETTSAPEPPEPWQPPVEGAPECELAADCPAGTYCDLGECIQECNTVDPCTGELVCHPRGRCAEDPAEPADPEPTTTPSAVVRSIDDVVYANASEAVVVLRFDASPADVTVRYRVNPRVPWLRVVVPRGSFEGALTLMLEIDRERLGTGSHSGDVVLHTTAGDVTVPVHLDQGLSAVYQGQIEYSRPRSLGSVPLRIEIREDHGTAAIRVDADHSPTFPAGDRQATATARFLDDTLSGSLVQRFAPAAIGGARTLIDREVGREVRFELVPSAGGGLVGTFTERWFGLFPAPVEVGGEVTLARVAGVSPGDYAAELPPELPPNPPANPPPLTSACRTAGSAAAGAAGGGCLDGVTNSQLVSCGDALLARGARLADATLVMESPTGESGYDEMSGICERELSASERDTPTASDGVVECLRPANLSCALGYYALAAQRGEPDANGRLGETVAVYADVGLLLVQDALVEAYRTPFRTDGASVASAMLSALEGGRGRAHEPLQFAFDPLVLETLRATAPAVAFGSEYRPLRRLAQLLARDRLAAEEAALIEVRTRGADITVVRERLHGDAMRLLVALVALSTIELAQEAPSSPELGLFAEALTELGRRSLELSDGVDPLGIPRGFVEFLYDPSMAGPDRATNFQQVLRAHEREVADAVVSEERAAGAVRDFDARVEAIVRAVSDAGRQIDGRLIQICGADLSDPSAPDPECGSATGELAEARNVYEQEVQGMRIALARIEGLDARIRIQRQRLEDVYRIRAETIAFVDSANRQINELEIRQAEIAAAREFISIAANSSLFNAGAPAALAAASMALSLYQAELAVRQMALQQAQGLQIMRADMRVEYVNGMATIQEMLVGMAELNLELVLAGIRAATAAIRVATLERAVQTANAERELLLSRELGSIANDPAFRILRDDAVESAIVARERALRGVYLAARAFEFETNTRLTAIETDLVPALEASQIQDFVGCLESSFTRFRSAYGVPQTFVDEISVREDVLGIRGPVEDPVTGEVVSEADQFRRLLLSPSNIGPDGTVGLSFVTTLSPGNGLFSTMVCNDQIRSVQVKLIGDRLGDDQARVYVWQGGTSLVRGCESNRAGRGDVMREYDIAPRRVEIQAGVNAYPVAAPDAQLFGRSVAATDWRIAVPPGPVAPTNGDLELDGIDDIVLRIEHSAISLSESPIDYTPVCGG